MSECEMVSRCFFFQGTMLRMPRMAARLKENFCHGDKSTCARYYVIMRIDAEAARKDPNIHDRMTYVLRTLFPNDMNAARKFIESMPEEMCYPASEMPEIKGRIC